MSWATGAGTRDSHRQLESARAGLAASTCGLASTASGGWSAAPTGLWPPSRLWARMDGTPLGVEPHWDSLLPPLDPHRAPQKHFADVVRCPVAMRCFLLELLLLQAPLDGGKRVFSSPERAQSLATSASFFGLSHRLSKPCPQQVAHPYVVATLPPLVLVGAEAFAVLTTYVDALRVDLAAFAGGPQRYLFTDTSCVGLTFVLAAVPEALRWHRLVVAPILPVAIETHISLFPEAQTFGIQVHLPGLGCPVSADGLFAVLRLQRRARLASLRELVDDWRSYPVDGFLARHQLTAPWKLALLRSVAASPVALAPFVRPLAAACAGACPIEEVLLRTVLLPLLACLDDSSLHGPADSVLALCAALLSPTLSVATAASALDADPGGLDSWSDLCECVSPLCSNAVAVARLLPTMLQAALDRDVPTATSVYVALFSLRFSILPESHALAIVGVLLDDAGSRLRCAASLPAIEHIGRALASMSIAHLASTSEGRSLYTHTLQLVFALRTVPVVGLEVALGDLFDTVQQQFFEVLALNRGAVQSLAPSMLGALRALEHCDRTRPPMVIMCIKKAEWSS